MCSDKDADIINHKCSICRHTKEASHYIAYHLIECQFYLHVYINRYFIHFISFAFNYNKMYTM